MSLHEKRAALLDQIDGILANDEVTAEDLVDVKEKRSEVETLDAEIQHADEVAAMRETVAEDREARSVPVRMVPNARVSVGRAGIEDDPKRGWRSLGELAAAAYHADPNVNMGVDERLHFSAAAGTGLEQGIRTGAGVLVPPAFSTTIWDGVREASNSLLGMCDQITVPDGVESLSFPAIAETARADGSRWGGLQGYWKSELAQMTESQPALREVKVEPQELYVFAYVSDKLLRNASVALEGWLGTKAADEINFKVGDAIINGGGAGMPKGILAGTAGTDAPRVEVSAETGQAATTIVKANIDKMYARMWAPARSGAVWLINQDCEPELENLAANVGTGGVPVYLPSGGYTDAPNARLKGLPVIPIEYAQTLGTAGDIMLVNMRYYLAATRGGVNSAASMHLKFDYNQTAFRFLFEADGQPWLESALTPFNSTDTLSPFVTLATRSWIMAGKDFLSDHHIVAGLYPVADCFAGGVATDVISLRNYRRCTFVILTGAIEDANISNLVTVDACSTAAAAATSTMLFRHRTCLSSTSVDTWSSSTAVAAVTGYNLTSNAAVANAMHIVEVTADEVAADGGNGYQFVRLSIAETANKTITAAVIVILSDPRYPGAVPETAIA